MLSINLLYDSLPYNSQTNRKGTIFSFLMGIQTLRIKLKLKIFFIIWAFPSPAILSHFDLKFGSGRAFRLNFVAALLVTCYNP